MKECKIRNLIIYKGDYSSEAKYRPELSKLLIEHLGDGPYSNHEIVRKAITFSYNYFCDKFIELCNSETSLRFYQLILFQHEQSTELALLVNVEEYPHEISGDYIPVYRRVLKWILEQACDIALHNQEIHDDKFVKRAKEKLNELYFLGRMIFTDATLYAEQDMIEDVAEVKFDKDNYYTFDHKHHYDFIIQKITENNSIHAIKHVVDKSPVEDLKQIIESCFGLKYEYLTTVIQKIHELNKDKGGQYCGFDWEYLPMNVKLMFSSDYQKARELFTGLTLDRNNKLKLQELACRPQTMFRYLYRPITIWNVEGKDFAFIGLNGFTECIIQLVTNAIPWGKAPIEWMRNKCFKDYVHLKEDQHDKWLDDEVEKKLREINLPFHRNVSNINTKNGYLSLIQKDVGEIDFIIINHDQKKIYISDNKHLQSRYDMMNQKNDFSNFTKDKGGYNNQISNKVKWVEDNLDNLNYHHKDIYGDSEPSIIYYKVEGIFIINTPTFYMYNSDYRIYTVDIFAQKITGKLADPELVVTINTEGVLTTLTVKYPYFRKPNYQLIDSLNTEE